MLVSIDIADAIQSALNDSGHAASAWPLPKDFEDRLPFTRVTALGGTTTDVVLDRFRVQLETWAETNADAMDEALLVAAELKGFAGGKLGDSPCYSVTITSLPHDAEDPYHPDLPVAETFAEVAVREMES